MLRILKQISEIPCINGSEHLLSEFLKRRFEEKGCLVSKICGHTLFVQKATNSECNPKSVIFTPMDSPGFICLYKDNESAFITPTSTLIKKAEQVADFKGN